MLHCLGAVEWQKWPDWDFSDFIRWIYCKNGEAHDIAVLANMRRQNLTKKWKKICLKFRHGNTD